MVAENKNYKDLFSSGNKTFIADQMELKDDFSHLNCKDLKFIQCEISNGVFESSTFIKWVYKSSCGSNLNFSKAVFDNCFSINYFFENTDFSMAQFKKSDFSGGSFNNCNFNNAFFESADFALCEFQNCSFEGSRFQECNFNGSIFEKCHFQDNLFHNTSLKSIEGLSEIELNNIVEQGADASFPLEVELHKYIKTIFKKKPFFSSNIIIFIIIFVLGFYSKSIWQTLVEMIYLEANPLHRPIELLTRQRSKPSYFYNKIKLPNYDFSDELDHWFLDKKTPDLNEKVLFIDQQQFASFPASLCSENYMGAVFFTKSKLMKKQSDNMMLEQEIWLPVAKTGEKLKLSFFYKNGHPTFSVYGKLKAGGHKLLAQIGALVKSENSNWVYYSEEILVYFDITAISIKMSQFPKERVYIDDVNIEKTL